MRNLEAVQRTLWRREGHSRGLMGEWDLHRGGRGGLVAAGAAADVKVCFDMIVAIIVLAALAPLMALIALCIVVESRGPVLYRAPRVGRRGEPLQVLKFRKMRLNATGRPLTVHNDERLTRVGRWLVRTKLDELPQLLNVVRGDMSLVGPRPEDSTFVRKYGREFEPILQVRPGLTGLSQIAFAKEAKILDRQDPIRHYEDRILPQKLTLDRLYVSRWSLLLDLRILFWTAVTVICRIPVAVSRVTANMNVRRRPRLSKDMLERTSPGPVSLAVESALIHADMGIGFEIAADGVDGGAQSIGKADAGPPPE
jgi:lipopolysaccharide/colanic/teichoic acid biosynthesis glycosyltransferase